MSVLVLQNEQDVDAVLNLPSCIIVDAEIEVIRKLWVEFLQDKKPIQITGDTPKKFWNGLVPVHYRQIVFERHASDTIRRWENIGVTNIQQSPVDCNNIKPNEFFKAYFGEFAAWLKCKGIFAVSLSDVIREDI